MPPFPLDIRLAAMLLLAAMSATSCNTQRDQEAMPGKVGTTGTETEEVETVTADATEPPETVVEKQDTTVSADVTEKPETAVEEPETEETGIATFGAGCFWCVEAVFQQLEGVLSVESGYCGGTVQNPTYRQICDGNTGHAEVCQIRFDPSKITFDELLEVFWRTHDPTTLNRQGNDFGTQYRSVVFYHDERQKTLAERRKRQLNAAGVWQDPVVTEISPYARFYKAESYHQNYYMNNASKEYCQFVIRPKVEKFRAVFKDRLKKRADSSVGGL